MRKKGMVLFLLAFVLVFALYSTPARAQGTWKKFETITETFENFMRNSPLGNKYDSGMNAIKTVTVRSEAEAVLVSNASGASLVYTERTIFERSGLNTATFSLAWGPMRGRYPIEMWTELRERTNDGIRRWIRGGEGAGAKHGAVDKDLVWIIEGGFAGMGAAQGWGLDTARKYPLGGGAAIHCSPNSNNHSFVMTITIPLDNYFNNEQYFTFDHDKLRVNLSFNSAVSGILKKSRLFRSDSFVLIKQ